MTGAPYRDLAMLGTVKASAEGHKKAATSIKAACLVSSFMPSMYMDALG